jgi:hypothetical protein
MSIGPQANDGDLVFRLIYDLLRNAGDPSSPLSAANALYNEGWLLRIAMELHSRGVKCLPIEFARDARWFSEPLLNSPFRARFRGDPLAERHTHADGVLGHVELATGSKRGLQIKSSASQFVVFEAKMYSTLSAGTKNCEEYDQATRNVACMAHTLSTRQLHPDKIESLAFIVVCPQECRGLHMPFLSKEVMANKITQRIGGYANTRPDEAGKLAEWSQQWLQPLLKKIEIQCHTWESIVSTSIGSSPAIGKAFEEFYNRCINAGRPAKQVPLQTFLTKPQPAEEKSVARPKSSGVSLIRLQPEFFSKFWPCITTPTYIHFSWGPGPQSRQLRHYPSPDGAFITLENCPSIAEIERLLDPMNCEKVYPKNKRKPYTECRFWYNEINRLNGHD